MRIIDLSLPINRHMMGIPGRSEYVKNPTRCVVISSLSDAQLASLKERNISSRETRAMALLAKTANWGRALLGNRPANARARASRDSLFASSSAATSASIVATPAAVFSSSVFSPSISSSRSSPSSKIKRSTRRPPNVPERSRAGKPFNTSSLGRPPPHSASQATARSAAACLLAVTSANSTRSDRCLRVPAR